LGSLALVEAEPSLDDPLPHLPLLHLDAADAADAGIHEGMQELGRAGNIAGEVFPSPQAEGLEALPPEPAQPAALPAPQVAGQGLLTAELGLAHLEADPIAYLEAAIEADRPK
jgi:hypothetical protein